MALSFSLRRSRLDESSEDSVHDDRRDARYGSQEASGLARGFLPVDGLLMLLLVTVPDAAHGRQGVQAFVHVVDTTAFLTVLDHPELNGDPNRRFIVQNVYNPYGVSEGEYNEGHIGLRYSTSSDKWTIENQNTTQLMPEGTKFFVMLPSDGFDEGLVHVLTEANTVGSVTTLDHAPINSSPYGRFVVTWVRNPGGGSGPQLNTQVSLTYVNPGGGRWQIQTVDGSDLPLGGAFNVFGFASPINTPISAPGMSTGTMVAGSSGFVFGGPTSAPFAHFFAAQTGTSPLTDTPTTAVYYAVGDGGWVLRTGDGSSFVEGTNFGWYSVDALFVDGFEAGDLSAWQ